MEPTYQKLYVAKSIEGLDQRANPKSQLINSTKFTQICKVLDRLYKNAQGNPLDQEATYIFLARFIYLYDKFQNLDKKFINIRFGKEYGKVKFQINDIRNNLIKRYEQKYGNKDSMDKIIVRQEVPEIRKNRLFNRKFITCFEMYSALQKYENILMVDARSSLDFEVSRMNIDERNTIINVPEECITSGLSANKLGQKLPPDTRQIWDKRDQYVLLILFDWDTTAENFNSSKLDKLFKALFEWDFNRNYNEPPVILSGGYLEVLQAYPTICINPQVCLQKRNTELDELLDIDNIVYPTEADNKAPVLGKPIAVESPPVQPPPQQELPTRDELLAENKNLSISLQNVISQLMNKEKEWMLIEKTKIAPTDNRRVKLQEDIKQLEDKLEDINAQKDKARQKFDLYAKFDPENETLKSDEVNMVDELEKKDDEKLNILNIMQEERFNALKRARASKPGLKNDEPVKVMDISGEPERPIINRATKPRLRRQLDIQPIPQLTTGRVGLKNVKNTCYMNTIIQCFRNLPQIQDLFCSGDYVKYVTKEPSAIIFETAFLVRSLWSRNVKSIEPTDFYQKACSIMPSYKLGHHEDCMEFYLFLLNNLNEDCSIDVERPQVMTPRQASWYKQFEGRSSIFLNLFYHQIRIHQFCSNCNRSSSYKFEIENSFMLSMPNSDSNLQDLMDDYMKDFTVEDQICKNCNRPVLNKKSIAYLPEILVIQLKRYRTLEDGTPVKMSHKVRFPLNNFNFGVADYDLNSIALHSGDMDRGHYTGACLTNDGWYEYSDERVKSVDIQSDSIQHRVTAFFYIRSDSSKNGDKSR